MRFFALLLFLLNSINSVAVTPTKAQVTETILYFEKMFGHLHKGPDHYSPTLTTIACGHPVRVLSDLTKSFNDDDWLSVKVSNYDGFLKKSGLTKQRPDCFQDRFPRFFDAMKLEISDLYYWGRLEDQYLHGRSRIR